MSFLIGDALKKAIKDNLIRIEPLDPEQIGPGSVDLTLGNDFRVFKKQVGVYHVRDDSNFEDVTDLVHVQDGDSLLINPGEMVLGITREKITLADTMAGLLEGRSRFARLGLAVHVTAGFMQPGIANRQVLEMVNMGHTPLAVYPQTKICQMIFIRCEGKARYRGRFRAQKTP